MIIIKKKAKKKQKCGRDICSNLCFLNIVELSFRGAGDLETRRLNKVMKETKVQDKTRQEIEKNAEKSP